MTEPSERGAVGRVEAAVAPAPRLLPSSLFVSRAGLVLIALSFLLWGALPIVPFLPLPTEDRVALGATLFIVMEVVWWGGLALAGPAAARRFSRWWRRRAIPGEGLDG